MSVDIESVRARVRLIRDVTRPARERSSAVLQATDDMLALCAEVEALRAACSPEATEIARRISSLNLLPVDDELVRKIASRLHTYALEGAPKRKTAATWDISAMPAAVRVIALVDNFIKRKLGGP